jgi:hypothetical protein
VAGEWSYAHFGNSKQEEDEIGKGISIFLLVKILKIPF